MRRLHACTASHDDDRICEMLAELHSMPAVLIVFNHPLWNLYALPAPEFQLETGPFS